MEFGIEKYAILIMKSRKPDMTDKMEQPNQEKLERSKKRKQIFGNIESRDDRKNFKKFFKVSQENEEATRN